MKLVRKACAPLGCTVRSVAKKEFSLPVGALAGVPGVEKHKPADPGSSFDDEMLVISGFSGEGLDILIGALYAGGVGKVPYKAVITETNASWDGVSLFDEIMAEHELMSLRRAK